MNRSLAVAFIILLISNIVLSQKSKVDSLKLTFKEISNDRAKVGILIQIAKQYHSVSLDSVHAFGLQAKAYAEAINYKSGLAQSLLVLGYSSLKRGDLVESQQFYEQAIQISTALGDKNLQADALTKMGLLHNYRGDYPAAIEKYRQAIELAESVNDSSLIATVYMNIGGVHFNLKDLDLALKYWKQALNIQLILGKMSSAGTSMNNVGYAFSEKNESDSALHYYMKSLTLYDDNRACEKVYPYENIGHLYMKSGNLDSASYYFNIAVNLARKCEDQIVLTGVLIGLGNVKRALKEDQEALTYFNSAFQIAKNSSLMRETSLAAQSLSAQYEVLGNPNKALHFYKYYHALTDSLFNDKNLQEIGRLEAKYMYEKLDRERELAQGLEMIREKWIKNTLIAGFLIMIIVALVTYRNFIKKKVSNRKLEALNKEIRQQQTVLISQSEELHTLNDSLNSLNDNLETKIEHRTIELEEKNKELEIKNNKLIEYGFINAHKLRAPVATILGLTKLFKHNITDDERNDIVHRILGSTEDLNTIVKEIQTVLEDENIKPK